MREFGADVIRLRHKVARRSLTLRAKQRALQGRPLSVCTGPWVYDCSPATAAFKPAVFNTDLSLIALTAFIKKTQATPAGEIALAQQRLKEATTS